MKANEIRLGNYVIDLKINKSKEIEYGDFEYSEDLEGIPLNEEWLLKFGFDIRGGNYWNCKNGFDFVVINDKIGFFLNIGGADFVEIEYVHKLQNLYFEIVGEELTVKN